MLGFEIGLWDYLTFATLLLTVVAFLMIFVFIAGLPGRIAISRRHPEAEAVKLLGWVGILPTIYPWVQALVWAVKPTNVIGLRFSTPMTTDARMIQHTIQLIPRLQGPTPVEAVLVAANTPVKQGQPLFRFDSTTAEAKV